MRNMPTQRRVDDKGFTLIELMVVVLIIAILLAIAIPTFLGAQNKAKDRSAQSSARNALTNAKVLYADNGTYMNPAATTPFAPTADAATAATALAGVEPGLTFTALQSTTPKTVSVLVQADGNAWFAAVRSDTGTCFYLRDSIAPSTTPGTYYAKLTNVKTDKCIASALPLVADGDVLTVYGAKW
jgi:type IV pilus assembly protein PilA